MRKKYVYKVSTALVSLSLIASLLCGCSNKNVSVNNTNSKASIEENNVLLSAVTAQANTEDKDTDKEETVYVIADSNGKIDETVVSEWLKTNGYVGDIKDVANLDDLENVKGDENVKVGDDGNITWKSNGKDIYYRGNAKKEVPVTITPKYTLDGKEISAKDLKGKSGEVVIRYDYTNNLKNEVEIEGKKEEIYTPFVVLTGLLVDTDKFSDIEVTNGKLVSDGTHNIVIGYAIPNLSDNLKLENIKDKKVELDIPDYIEIKANVKDFELGDSMSLITTSLFDDINLENGDVKDLINDLDEASGKLSESSEKLVEGTGKLDDGVSELDGKMEEFADGTSDLKKGIKDYTGGVKKAKKGADKIVKGGNTLSKASKKINKGSKKLKNGVKTLKKGTSDLNTGAKSAKNGSKKLDDGAKDLRDGLKKLSTGSGALKSGIGLIDAGIDKLDGGFATLTANDKNLIDGSASISQGISGIKQYADGAKKYSDAIKQNKESLLSLYSQLSQAGMTEQAASILNLYGALYGDGTETNPGLTNVVDGLDNVASKVEMGYNGVKDAEGNFMKNEKGEYINVGFDSSLKNYVGGVESLSKGALELNDGMTKIVDGIDELDKGVTGAYTGSKTLKNGTKSLYDGLVELESGTAQVDSGVGTLYSGTQDLYKGTYSFNNGLGKFVSGIEAVDEGLGTISDNNKKLNSGARQIDNAAEKIKDAVSQLHEGTTSLDNGMIKFDEEGIQKLTDALKGSDGAYERLVETVKAGQNYQSFAGKTDNQKSQVKFIYKIKGI